MLTLDVGCGDKPKGHVNCDIYRNDNPQVYGSIAKSVPTNPKHVSNFILASGLYLPFKPDCFDIVYSRYVIEHTSEPQHFLNELIRVCKGEVRLIAPHRYAAKRGGKYHQSYLNLKWFADALKGYGYEIEYTYRQFPLFFLPDQISVIVYKRAIRNEDSNALAFRNQSEKSL